MKIIKSLLATAAAVAALSTLVLAEPPAKDGASPAATTTTQTAKATCHTAPAAAKKDGAMDMSKGMSEKAAMPMAGCCGGMTK